MSRNALAIVVLGLAALGAGYLLMPQDADPTDAGAAMVDVAMPDLAGAAAAGQGAFATHCADCHGPAAAGREGAGPPLIHRIYEPSHHGDMSFVLAVRQGVIAHHWTFGNMPAVPGVSDEEIADIIAFIRTVQRANGIN